jgi:hypothetical protein
LLAAWDAEHPGAVGESYLASVGGSVWTIAEERGDDFVLHGERGEAWEVSRDFLAAEVSPLPTSERWAAEGRTERVGAGRSTAAQWLAGWLR